MLASCPSHSNNREAVRVIVQKCEEGSSDGERRKFSVDPQITSLQVLRSLLCRAFDLNGRYSVWYMAREDLATCGGRDTYLPLLSDWDLDAAFLGSSDPHLALRVECHPRRSVASDDGGEAAPREDEEGRRATTGLAGSILNQVERTLTMVQRAARSLVDGEQVGTTRRGGSPPPAAMADAEFRRFLDPEGKVVRPRELRRSVFRGGVDPALRRVAWKHVLNVYPEGLTGRERVEYVRRKGNEYYRLRTAWQDAARCGQLGEDAVFVTNMVRKDVLRTDRTHEYFAGSDDNANVVSLFNVLATYALYHPSVSYCQGMSDLASPVLVVMRDEAQAYVSFCALMKRLRPNFLLDGEAMSLKFLHLAEALKSYDPAFFSYLRHRQADDLLFCYRWLLLEMKREFAFDDALRMLEVLWSSLPPDPPRGELPLYEVEFEAPGKGTVPRAPRPKTKENAYTKVRAIRRQSSGSSATGVRRNGEGDVSLPSERKALASTPRASESDDDVAPAGSPTSSRSSDSSAFGEPSPMTNSCEEALEGDAAPLAPPGEFGGGNPFLMFLCLTLLLQHRDHIVDRRMDYNELAMHFDKMVRKHDVTRVLRQARALYAEYMRRSL